MTKKQPECRLYVGNLDFRLTREDVNDMFSEVGFVVDVFFPRDLENKKRPHRGFVFVEMRAPAEAEEAVEEFNGTEDDYGRKLIVKLADKRKKRD